MIRKSLLMIIAIVVLSVTILAGCSSRDISIEGSGRLTGVTVLEQGDLWVSGIIDGKGIIFSFDGSGWVVQKEVETQLRNIFCLGDCIWTVGDEGTVIAYNGKWKEEKVCDETLVGGFALDDSHIWVTGEKGVVFFYDGDSWTKQDSGVRWNIESVYALSPDCVWFVGAGGVLFFDGQTMTLQYETQGRGNFSGLYDVVAKDNKNVWAVGSIDGGYTSTVLFYDGKSWEIDYSIKKQRSSDMVGNKINKAFRSVCLSGRGVCVVGTETVLKYDGAWEDTSKNDCELKSVSAGDNKVCAVGCRYIYEVVEARERMVEKPIVLSF